MADGSVRPQVNGLAALFLDPAQHSHPVRVVRMAQCESATLMDEMESIADLLFLASTNPDSQMRPNTVAYAAMLIRRLTELKVCLDALEVDARAAATTALRLVSAGS